MKAKALEIRWHETSPIYSADFQQVRVNPHNRRKSAHGSSEHQAAGEGSEGGVGGIEGSGCWRLATAGGDNNVRIWLVHPNSSDKGSLPFSSSKSKGKAQASDDVRVEYMATLAKHTAIVNVVRFCPKGDMLASAGDDGNVLLWVPSDKASSVTFGDTAEEKAYEKEAWRVRVMARLGSHEIYALAWSPDGEWFVTGSTDNTARIFNATDGQCVHQIAEHNNYIQGVAWDPLNQYIATQSSDRSMHVYAVQLSKDGSGSGEAHVHAVGSQHHPYQRIDIQHKKGGTWSVPYPTPSSEVAGPSVASSSTAQLAGPSRPTSRRSISIASEAENSETSNSPSLARGLDPISAASDGGFRLPTPAQSTSASPTVASNAAPRTNAAAATSHSRRSSFSGSNASPPHSYSHARPGRSPSPIPPLPAIKQPSPNLDARHAITTSKAMYGDENVSPFFRRLAWSPDGSLLVTPAGLFEDPFALPSKVSKATTKENQEDDAGPPQRKKRKSDSGAPQTSGGPKPTIYVYSRGSIDKGPIAHLPGHKSAAIAIRFCPAVFELRRGLSQRGADPGGESGKPIVIDLDKGSEVDVDLKGEDAREDDPDDRRPPATVFDLPYRMVYAVSTHESVLIYDTQQSSPICLFGNLHYAPFTDLAWSPDGLTLMLASQDGYCSAVSFESGELGRRYRHSIPGVESSFLSSPIGIQETPTKHPSTSQPHPPPPSVEMTTTTSHPPKPPPSTTTIQEPIVIRSSSPPTSEDAQQQQQQQPKTKKRRVELKFEGRLG